LLFGVWGQTNKEPILNEVKRFPEDAVAPTDEKVFIIKQPPMQLFHPLSLFEDKL